MVSSASPPCTTLSARRIFHSWCLESDRFFLDLESVENLEEAEEAVFSARADLGWVKQLEQRDIQYEWKTLPFTELLDWENWSVGYVKWLFEEDQEAGMAFISGQQARWNEAVWRIRDARVPVEFFSRRLTTTTTCG